MARRGHRQRQAAGRPAAKSTLERGGKIEIARLEVRRIGVGNVAGQHLLTTGAQTKCLLMELEIAVKLAEHRALLDLADENRGSNSHAMPERAIP